MNQGQVQVPAVKTLMFVHGNKIYCNVNNALLQLQGPSSPIPSIHDNRQINS